MSVPTEFKSCRDYLNEKVENDLCINNNNDIESDHIVYLTLGDGDFSYSLDLVRYCVIVLTSGMQKRPLKLVLSGFDTFEAVTEKYKDAPSILQEIRKLQEKTPLLTVSIRHGVNAIVNQDDETLGYYKCKAAPAVSAHHVLFHHPHIGTEDCSLHKRFLAHLFHSATNYWMKKQGGIFHLTLVEGQYDRWECLEQAKRHGLGLLHQSPFIPPSTTVDELQKQKFDKNNTRDEIATTITKTKTNGKILLRSDLTNNIGLTGNRYHFRRHQTGKSFASRRPKSTSTTYTFGRITDKGMYVATTIPWHQPDFSSHSSASEEGICIDTKIKCRFCYKEFFEERSLKCHIRDKHPNEVRINDTKQPKKKKKKNTTSVSIPNDVKSLFCPHCQHSASDEPQRRIFQSTKALEAHIRAKHSAIYKYIAPDWSIAKQKETKKNKSQEQSNKLDSCDEYNVDNNKVDKCHICGFQLVGRSFSKHLQEFNPSTTCTINSSQFSCIFCSKSFREERAKMQHMNFCSKRPTLPNKDIA